MGSLCCKVRLRYRPRLVCKQWLVRPFRHDLLSHSLSEPGQLPSAHHLLETLRQHLVWVYSTSIAKITSNPSINLSWLCLLPGHRMMCCITWVEPIVNMDSLSK